MSRDVPVKPLTIGYTVWQCHRRLAFNRVTRVGQLSKFHACNPCRSFQYCNGVYRYRHPDYSGGLGGSLAAGCNTTGCCGSLAKFRSNSRSEVESKDLLASSTTPGETTMSALDLLPGGQAWRFNVACITSHAHHRLYGMRA